MGITGEFGFTGTVGVTGVGIIGEVFGGLGVLGILGKVGVISGITGVLFGIRFGEFGITPGVLGVRLGDTSGVITVLLGLKTGALVPGVNYGLFLFGIESLPLVCPKLLYDIITTPTIIINIRFIALWFIGLKYFKKLKREDNVSPYQHYIYI